MKRRRSCGADGGPENSISVISRALRKLPKPAFTVLKYHGGIAPEPVKDRTNSLTLVEREVISRSIVSGDGVRSIASALGRPLSSCLVCSSFRRSELSRRPVGQAARAKSVT